MENRENTAQKRKGQAMTEMVLIFPMFIIMTMIVLKLFALVLVVQKTEIASAYASRKWMLEAHRNANYFGWDDQLKGKINSRVQSFIKPSKFTGVASTYVTFNRTQVWTQVTVQVCISSPNIPLLCVYPKDKVCSSYDGPGLNGPCSKGYEYICGGSEACKPSDPNAPPFKGVEISASKFVPVRDRPIAWSLPSV